MHKYILKTFYTKTNKKEYNLQIWEHNVSHINIIAMQNIIILEKTRRIKKLLVVITDTTTPVEMGQALSLVDLVRRYKWAMSNTDLDIAKKQELIDIKKY